MSHGHYGDTLFLFSFFAAKLAQPPAFRSSSACRNTFKKTFSPIRLDNRTSERHSLSISLSLRSFALAALLWTYSTSAKVNNLIIAEKEEQNVCENRVDDDSQRINACFSRTLVFVVVVVDALACSFVEINRALRKQQGNWRGSEEREREKCWRWPNM